ncbi:MAG: ApaG [Hyphomonadaceae bacterium BRH_c29]|jgi:ApaG protein|nr:MAG: ApaG [Hyphomonadaceae bacterium BRH_c29]
MARRSPPPQYEQVTDGVRIRVRPKFMYDESEPASGRFMWSYTVDVENESDRTWTIIRRHWEIIDALGHLQAVDGEGVIGQTPTLGPGERFSYTSGAPLAAPSGMMRGTYDLIDDEGGELVAQIPAFSLDSPYDTSRPI